MPKVLKNFEKSQKGQMGNAKPNKPNKSKETAYKCSIFGERNDSIVGKALVYDARGLGFKFDLCQKIGFFL